MDFQFWKTPLPNRAIFSCSAILTTRWALPSPERNWSVFPSGPESRELVICSDEIHCDLLLDPVLRHIPLGNLDPETAEHTITLMAPSKTYNLPGFGCSFAIISNSDLRIRFKKAMAGIVPDPAAMGFHLADSAYKDGEEWAIPVGLLTNQPGLRNIPGCKPCLGLSHILSHHLSALDGCPSTEGGASTPLL